MRRLLPLTALLVLAAGCGKSSTAPPDAPAEDVALAGGNATVFDATSSAYTLPMPRLSADALGRHFEGDGIFERAFVTAPAGVASGLGPAFNKSSCAGCHVRNGRAKDSRLLRVSIDGFGPNGGPNPAPGLGVQLQDHAVFGRAPEATFESNYVELTGTFGDGMPYTLRVPTVVLLQAAHPLPAGMLTSVRVGSSMVGMGLLEAVSEETALAYGAQASAHDPAVSGRANRVWNVRTQTVEFGRFGWKAGEPDVRQQSAHAFQQDMGITSPDATSENTAGQPDYDDGLPDDPEIDESTLEAAAHYVRTLGVPARRALDDRNALRGERVFAAVGCVSCHAPRLVTGTHPSVPELSNQVIRPYTDLLVHDLGEELGDGRPDFGAGPNEWRTAPLWGLGLLETVNGHAELLHDGRARSFMEAILWHGGEAAPARDRVKALPVGDRDALVAFLRSL